MNTHGYCFLILFSIFDFIALGKPQTGQLSDSYRYMVELYKRYRNERKKSGVTVRSILPTKGEMEGSEMLVYNLTSVPRTEIIIKAELHAYLHNRKSKTHAFILSLWDVEPPLFLPLERRDTGRETGWIVHNVTQAVLKCKTRKMESQSYLGVSLQNSSFGRTLHPHPVDCLSDSNSQPFLVIFSEDKLSNLNLTDTFQPHLDDVTGLMIRRERRSLGNNSLPEHPVYQFSGMPLTLTSSRLLHRGRKKQRDKKGKMRHRKHSFFRANLNRPHENDATITEDEEIGIGICRRRKFVVEFKDMGWSQYIIAPDHFTPGYCSGQCPLQLMKSISWSNHATLQSLVYALKLDPDVPPPCCVPDITSSLSLLFLDEGNTIILKNYPNMIVESCACR